MKNIPEKWCVRRTSNNAEVLNAWYRSKRFRFGDLLSTEILISSDLDFYHCAPVDYPEITFQQWQIINSEWVKENCSLTFEPNPKLVLGRPRKILGYVFKEDVTPAIKKAAGIIAHMDTCPGPDYDFTEAQLDSALFFPDSPTHKALEKAGVMHWFKIKYS